MQRSVLRRTRQCKYIQSKYGDKTPEFNFRSILISQRNFKLIPFFTKRFGGQELKGKTMAVIGLGHIGVCVETSTAWVGRVESKEEGW